MQRCCWILIALVAIGCAKGPEQVAVYPVKGQVMAGGKPAVNALVFLHPVDVGEEQAQQLRPRAQVDADGNYSVSTYGDGDGAPAGNYSITVTWPTGEGDGNDPEMAISGEDRLMGRYAEPGGSEFAVVVKEGDNEAPPIELELPRGGFYNQN